MGPEWHFISKFDAELYCLQWCKPKPLKFVQDRIERISLAKNQSDSASPGLKLKREENFFLWLTYYKCKCRGHCYSENYAENGNCRQEQPLRSLRHLNCSAAFLTAALILLFFSILSTVDLLFVQCWYWYLLSDFLLLKSASQIFHFFLRVTYLFQTFHSMSHFGKITLRIRKTRG